MENELQMLKNELLETQKEMVINLSATHGDFASPQAARESVETELRVKGLIICYTCDGRLLIDRYTGNNATDYSHPYHWEAILGTQNNGMVTDLNYLPKSWELRKGSYFTSELKGILTNFKQHHGAIFHDTGDGQKKFTVGIRDDKSAYFTVEVDKYTGSEFQWGAITRGLIQHLRTYDENGETFTEVIVHPNTMCAGVANKMTIAEGGTLSVSHDRKLKEGTFKLKIDSSRLFTLAVSQSGSLIAFSSPAYYDIKNILPPMTLSKDTLLIGFFCDAQCPMAPFSREYVLNNEFARSVSSTNLSERTFVNIWESVKGLNFKGEALLNDTIESEPDTYYLTLFETPGTYRYNSISFDVTTTKPKTVVAIRYVKPERETSYKWDAIEVPVSSIPQERTKIDDFTIDPGVYVVIDKIGVCPNLIGRSVDDQMGRIIGSVKIIFLGGLTTYPTVNLKNIEFYNAVLSDFYGKKDYTIEGCKFTGHPAHYSLSYYFLNTGYYDRARLHNVVIRNCVFDLPALYTTIWGEKLNTIEITGCEFNTKEITHPIRINYCVKGALIRNNTVNNGITGIFFGSNREMPISNCIIENNIVTNQKEEAIAFDGFGNNLHLLPVIGNGKIEEVSNDANGRLVVKPQLKYMDREGYAELPIFKMSDLSNWTDYYATFNNGTGIDGTLCRIYSFDTVANTLTLDIFMNASKVSVGDGSDFGVQSGFFDCVVRNNIIKSDREDYCTALSIYLNVFNMLIENNKVYRMNSFMNIAGGTMLGHFRTLAWGNKIINNTFMNCNIGSFYSYHQLIYQYNNVFRGNILKNVKDILIEKQRNFDYNDNIFDNVESARIYDCEGYVPNESELKVYHLGQVYNKFINNNDEQKSLYDIEQKIVRRDANGNLILKNLA